MLARRRCARCGDPLYRIGGMWLSPFTGSHCMDDGSHEATKVEGG